MVSKVKISDTANSLINVAETKFYEVDLRTPCLFRILQTRNRVSTFVCYTFGKVSKILWRRFRATFNFRKFKVALNPLHRIFSKPCKKYKRQKFKIQTMWFRRNTIHMHCPIINKLEFQV